MPHISLAAEKIGIFFGLPVTNALLTTWLVMILLFVLAYLATKNLSLVPGKMQSIAELVIGGLYDFFHGVIGNHVKQAFPVLASLFLFIILANWVGLLPGVGTIGFFEAETPTEQEAQLLEEPTTSSIAEEAPKVLPDTHAADEVADVGTVAEEEVHEEGAVTGEEEQHGTKFVPLFRGATADLNTTLALALFSVLAIQYFGFRTVGAAYGKRFIDMRDPIYFFVGILEILSDVSKIVSFAFRLFGNIFAGEVLLAVMAFLMPFIVPLPFLMLELFVGFVQALVFSMLTAVFLNVALSHGEHESGEHAHA